MASSSSGGDGTGDGSDRRYKRDLKGLLQFCLENTKSEDASAEAAAAAPQPMDEERRRWLTEALENMKGPDPIKLIIENVKILKSDADTDEREAALENIQDWCDDLDIAKDFHTIGGFGVVPSLLRDEEAGIRWRAADLVANLVQNNPYCQERALEAGFLPQLLQLLDKDEDSQVRIKALYAVSCMSRDVEAAQSEFLENDGFSVLIRAMQSDVAKLQLKAAFMLTAMCAAQPAYKDTLCNLGMVEQLVSLLSSEHSDAHEHIINCLLTLVRNHDNSIKQCHREELQLRTTLTQRIEYLAGKDEFKEEMEYAKELMKICFPTGSCVER